MFKRILFMALLACNYTVIFANTPQLAAETAIETWWYFKAHLNNPKWKQSEFMVRTADGRWVGKITSDDKVTYKGCVIGAKKGEYMTDCITFDSSQITDWAFNDAGVTRGAFNLRIKGVKKSDKVILSYMESSLVMNRTVGDDFIALSRWKGKASDLDSMSYYFFDSRYKGGIDQFYKYLQKAIVYPSFARKIGMEGYCYISFGVEKSGKVSDPVVVQSIGGGCKEVSYKVIRDIPELCEDEYAQTIRFTLPIKYMLK